MPSKPRARVANCPVCNKDFRAVKDQNGRFGGKIKLQKYCSKACWSTETKDIDTKLASKQVRGRAIKLLTQRYINGFIHIIRNQMFANTAKDRAIQNGRIYHRSIIENVRSTSIIKCGYCDKAVKTTSSENKQYCDMECYDWLNLCKSCHFKFDGENHKNFRRYK